MNVLVTRPEADAAALAEELAARGHSAVIEPLFTIVAGPEAALDLSGVQAVALTSANGARALAGRTARRDLPVFAVGDATAAAARAAGFAEVESAGGDVALLAALIASRLDPGAGPVLHAAARRVAGDLKGRLEQAGFAYGAKFFMKPWRAGLFPEDRGGAAAAASTRPFFSLHEPVEPLLGCLRRAGSRLFAAASPRSA